MLTNEPKPIRRVVTGNDAQGRSKVMWDGPAPNSHEASLSSGRGHTDIWVWEETPLPINGTTDDGNIRYTFCGPPGGGHFRVVQARALPAGYDRAKDPDVVAPHPPQLRKGGAGVWERGGNSLYESSMHKTQTLDYGIVIGQGRDLILDDCRLAMNTGDTVIQVGAWHQWHLPRGVKMAFDMIYADFGPDGKGLAQGNDQPLRAAHRHHRPHRRPRRAGGRHRCARRATGSGAAGFCRASFVGGRQPSRQNGV
jgi:hypothetical protein